MRNVIIACLLMGMTAGLVTQSVKSPYIGQEQRQAKALAENEIAAF